MSEDYGRKVNKMPAGVITPPPSKSISHRALICACLAGGEEAASCISNLGTSNDIAATQNAINTILNGDSTKKIEVGESGSTLRFLIPLALDGKEWTFTGAASLFARPLKVYEDIIKAAGGIFELSESELKVKSILKNGTFEIPGNISSQFISGLLFALPLLDAGSEIKLTTNLESESYVNLTIDCMKHYGVNIEKSVSNGKTTGYLVKGGQKYIAKEYSVEADYSQAAFFLCAAALGADVKVAGLSENSLQGDKNILEVLRSMGAKITVVDGNIEVQGKNSNENPLSGTTIDVSDIPDLVPPIAALACYAKGTTRLINASRLKIKESDRLEALASELKKIGADITATNDELIIRGKQTLKGGVTDSWNDHRIAMALALASIGCESDVIIKRSDAVSKSYPKFWDDYCVVERQNGENK